MQEERGTADLKASHATKVPQLRRPESGLVPGNRGIRVRNDQHHGDHRPRSGRVAGRGGTIFRLLGHAHSMPDLTGSRATASPEGRATSNAAVLVGTGGGLWPESRGRLLRNYWRDP